MISWVNISRSFPLSNFDVELQEFQHEPFQSGCRLVLYMLLSESLHV